MNSSHNWSPCTLAATMTRAFGLILLIFLFLVPQPSLAVSIQPGDIILNDFGAARLQVYSPAGNLRLEMFGPGGTWSGAAVLPGTNQVVTTRRTGGPGAINLFSADGTEQSFFTPDVTFPGDVSVFPDGTLAISSQITDRVELYATTGTHIGGFAVAGQPVGSTVGLDNTLWVGRAFIPGLSAYKQDGTFIRTIASNIVVGDVAVDPTNGTLWISQNTSAAVFNFDLLGNQLNTFLTGITPGGLAGQDNFRGLAVAHDGTIYVTSELSTSIFHYSVSGTLLGSFPLVAPSRPMFMAVVPVPEPSGPALIAGVMLYLSFSSRDRRRLHYESFTG